MNNFFLARSLTDGNQGYYMKCQKQIEATYSIMPNTIEKLFKTEAWKLKRQRFEQSIVEGELAKKSANQNDSLENN